LTNSISFSNNTLRDTIRAEFSYLKNFIFSKFRMAMIFTILLSATSNHIIGVVLKRTKIKMLRINTRRIIAFMKHAHFFWYISKVKLPRKPMSCHFAGATSSSMPNSSVSPFISGSSPKPTGRSFFSMLKKLNVHRDYFSITMFNHKDNNNIKSSMRLHIVETG